MDYIFINALCNILILLFSENKFGKKKKISHYLSLYTFGHM